MGRGVVAAANVNVCACAQVSGCTGMIDTKADVKPSQMDLDASAELELENNLAPSDCVADTRSCCVCACRVSFFFF